MTFDNIIANPPYSKLGVDIVNKIIKEVPYRDISILGTRAMFKKHNDVLNIEYVYIENYTLSPVTKCKWVKQIILLGHKGQCSVIPKRSYDSRYVKSEQPNEIRITFSNVASGALCMTLSNILYRKQSNSVMLSLSDGDYEYIKAHWDNMTLVERFWWLHDHGFFKRYITING